VNETAAYRQAYLLSIPLSSVVILSLVVEKKLRVVVV